MAFNYHIMIGTITIVKLDAEVFPFTVMFTRKFLKKNKRFYLRDVNLTYLPSNSAFVIRLRDTFVSIAIKINHC